jgi:hypothetical protein
MFSASGVKFLTSADMSGNKPPIDMIVYPSELARLNTFITAFTVIDKYSIGPYNTTSELISANSNVTQPFVIHVNNTATHEASEQTNNVPRVYKNTTVEGNVANKSIKHNNVIAKQRKVYSDCLYSNSSLLNL